MRIRLCAFSDEASPSLEGQIAALLKNGIRYTELRSIDGKNVKEFSLAYAELCAARLKESGVSVWAIGSPLGKSEIDGDFAVCLEEARHIFRLANIFGTTRVRIFSFFHAYERREEVVRRLNALVSLAKEYGVTLCHENEKDIYGDTAERVLDLLDSVKGLGSVYDPANFLQVGESAQKTLSLLHPRSDYFHIKDVISLTGELVPAGYGDGEISRLIELVDRDVVFTVEPHLDVFKGYHALDSHELKHRFVYASGEEAFGAAVSAIKKLLTDSGYREEGGDFVK